MCAGGARQGRERDRERRSRARGHRPRGVPRSHGRASGGRGNLDDRDRRRRRPRLRRQRDHGRPRRSRAPCSWRAASRAARSSSSGRGLEHLEIVVMKLCEMGMRVSPTPDGLWAQSRRPPRRGRRRDAAASGVRDRLHADRRRADGRGRRQRDRDREHLRRPLPVRRRARAHGRRRAHRRSPRGRARRRAAVGRAGAPLPTSAPAPRWCSPGSAAEGETVVYQLRARRSGLCRPPGHAAGRSVRTWSASTEGFRAPGNDLRYWRRSPWRTRRRGHRCDEGT